MGLLQVVVFAEVKDGVAPILGARVIAKLQRLGTNATGASYQPFTMALRDDGVGGEGRQGHQGRRRGR